MCPNTPIYVSAYYVILLHMCRHAGKALLRLSELVERGTLDLLLNILSILDAAAPHSLREPKLPLVLGACYIYLYM